MNRVRPVLGGGWTLWRQLLVRGAGFPFSLLDRVFRAEDTVRALRETAANDSFREAVLWQNRPAVASGLDALLRHRPQAQNAKARQQQQLVAKYLQRYCAKNDTIGFFGPVGWATAGGIAHFETGPTLISARKTCFEPWAVLALARAESGEARMLAPVRLPGHWRVDGENAWGPTLTVPLTKDELRMVQAADGRSAEDLLRGLSQTAEGQLRWRRVLQRLVARDILRWQFPVSISLELERQWRTLARSPNLQALRDCRDAVARAAGNPGALSTALESMESAFELRAGVAPWRHAGRAHGGRGLVFEECRRAISMDLGAAPIRRVAPALQVVLRVARWYTFSIATRLARDLLDRHRRRIPLHIFWRETAPLFDMEIPPAVDGAARQLRDGWNRMWSRAETRDGRQHLDVARAGSFVNRHFRAPCPGWPGARHHAPDLMWDAPDAEALLAGAGTPVLAELHPGVTPFSTLSVLSLCPVLDELAAEWEADFPDPLVSPIPWEDFARSSHDARLAKRHWHLDLGGEFASDLPPQQVLRAADFDVVKRRGRLVAAHSSGGPELDLIGVFERRIKLRAAVGFSLSDGKETGPRRYLGPLLVQRAHWRVESLPFGAPEDRLARVRDWREALGLPERIYVRVPDEAKPIYVDLASPVSIEMLIRFTRRAPFLSISEMYPAPGGLWLRDRAGESYTSELRMIAVDPKPFDAERVWAAAAHLI